MNGQFDRQEGRAPATPDKYRMTQELHIPTSDGPYEHHWIVRFAFRFNNQSQAAAVQSLGKLAWDVVRLWCDVLVPDAQVVQLPGERIETIGFPTRASARRFIKVWGGRIAATS